MTETEIAKAIAEDKELLCLLMKRPKLFRDIRLAAVFLEKYMEVRAAYLSGTEEGFKALATFIIAMEVPDSIIPGDYLRDNDGRLIFPFEQPTGDYLNMVFARWLYRSTFSEVRDALKFQKAAQSENTLPDEEPVQKKPNVN